MTAVAELVRDLSPEEQAALAARTRAHAARLRITRECPTPLDLASRFDQTTVRTPALELLADRLREVARTRDGRLVVSVPPQEGKTSIARWLCTWLLADDPDRRIVYASYAASLARSSGRMVRGYVQTHGRELGLSVSRDHADASDWQLDGHVGGMVTVGVGGSLTGKPADVLFIDDPLRNQKDADSETVRDTLHDWWSSVARTRLAPGAPVIVVQTRWVEDDLAGRRIAEGWPSVNIPALADGKTEDALDRPAGEWLVSARGRTVEDWEQTRKDVGERTFAALYQGRPAPLEGGVFKSKWFDTWRLTQLPDGCDLTLVVDPADNEGDGDEAGMILAGWHRATGKIYIMDDLSAPMTVARWARMALLTCVRRNAPTLAYEKSLSQLPKRIKDAQANLVEQATALAETEHDHGQALSRIVGPDASTERRELVTQQLAELTVEDVDAVLAHPSGPSLRAITAKGTKQERMLWVAPMFETGRACMVGTHPKLEHEAATWQPGQDSPDRVDAMTHAAALANMARPGIRHM